MPGKERQPQRILWHAQDCHQYNQASQDRYERGIGRQQWRRPQFSPGEASQIVNGYLVLHEVSLCLKQTFFRISLANCCRKKGHRSSCGPF